MKKPKKKNCQCNGCKKWFTEPEVLRHKCKILNMKKSKYKITDYHDFTTKDMPQEARRKLDVGNIWLNRIQCKKCKDIITSNNRHDMKYCKCGAVFVDGGSWYGRAGGKDLKDIIEMHEMFNDIKS